MLPEIKMLVLSMECFRYIFIPSTFGGKVNVTLSRLVTVSSCQKCESCRFCM